MKGLKPHWSNTALRLSSMTLKFKPVTQTGFRRSKRVRIPRNRVLAKLIDDNISKYNNVCMNSKNMKTSMFLLFPHLVSMPAYLPVCYPAKNNSAKSRQDL